MVTAFDRKLIGEAVRLFEGRAVSDAEADKLRDRVRSREEFLEELWFRRGSLARLPDLAATIERAQGKLLASTDWDANGETTQSRDPAAFTGDRIELTSDSGERAFYERLLAALDAAEPTAIYVPRWRGVANSTRNLFRQTIPIPAAPSRHPDDIRPPKIAFYADLLLASRIRHFVISGGDIFHLALITSVLQQDPNIRFDVLWHSGYVQMGELHDWRLLCHWLSAVKDGAVTRIGVVKSGLDVFLRQLGLDAVFVPNVIGIDPERLRPTEVTDIAGIWLSGSTSYRKLPHAMIAAVKAMRGFYLKGAGLQAEGLALVSALDVPFLQLFENPIPHQRLQREMAQTAVSLYVTISECSPMLPLESFALGVPCLVGPSSHLFGDHVLLREMLVVEQPYNPGLIADMAIAAVMQRHELVAAYRGYIREEEARAHAALARFLA